MILWIYKKIPRPKPYQSRDVIATDINERKTVYGDGVINGEEERGIERAYRYKVLAEDLRRRRSS